MVFAQVCVVWVGCYGWLCWVYCFARQQETRQVLSVGEKSVSIICLVQKRKKQKRKQKSCYSIYISSFIPISFFHPSSWFRFGGPQNCVSPICSHSDNHRSRITSGLPCQLWLIRFHHRTRINLSHHFSSSSSILSFSFANFLSLFLLPRSVMVKNRISPQSQRSRQKSRGMP
jgi:hypothetical protein